MRRADDEDPRRAFEAMCRAVLQADTATPEAARDLARAAERAQEGLARETRKAGIAAGELTHALEGLRAVQERAGADAARQASVVDLVTDRLRLLSERAGEIASAAETIDDISSKIGLLSLNAALESARSLESNQGFVLFPQEVRKLSERAGTVARDVAALIARLQAEVSSAVAVMDELRSGARSTAQTASRGAGDIAEAVRRSEDLQKLLVRLQPADAEDSALTEELRATRDRLRELLSSGSSISTESEASRILEEIARAAQRQT